MVIDALLPKLPAGARRVVELRFIDDLERKAIAAKLGVSINTAKTQLVRGIDGLRHELGITPQARRP
jgi:DNA-directed RNA polymerase specialized sigma24 family protein